MKHTYSPGFEKCWRWYPSRGAAGNPKHIAFLKWQFAIKKIAARGYTEDDMEFAVRSFAAAMKKKGDCGTEFVPMARTWFQQERYWEYLPKDEAFNHAKVQTKSSLNGEIAERWQEIAESLVDINMPRTWLEHVELVAIDEHDRLVLQPDGPTVRQKFSDLGYIPLIARAFGRGVVVR